MLLPPGGIPAIASVVALSQALDEAAVGRAEDAIRDASLVVCQLEAPLGCARAAFRLGRRHGARTLLNPAPSAVLDDELLALTDVLIPNEHEAADLVGAPGSPAEHARLLSQRVGGAGGDRHRRRGRLLPRARRRPGRAPPRAERRRAGHDGAGDAFVGALAVRLRAGDELRDAAAWPCRAAAVSVGRPGTIPPTPRPTRSPRSPPSLLERAGQHAADEAALQDQVDDHDRERDQHGGGGDLRRVARPRRAGEVAQAERRGGLARAPAA